ncbi:hypothetical protein [Chlorogloeopsis sp. ULAP02]
MQGKFAFFSWFDVLIGNFHDWAIADVSFWWQLIITTVLWNVYFQAK